MRPIKNSIIALFAMLSIGCAHKESDEVQISDVQVIIEAQFADTDADTVAIAKATRVTTIAFESGDLLGLYAVKSGGELNAASNLINNHQLKVSESGAITGGELPAYYPDKSSSLDLFSYYPYQSGNATADALGVLVGIRTTQTDFSSLQASDLCYGRKLDAAPTAAPHPLQFSHSFAQLRLNFSLYEGCSAIAAVKLLSIKDQAKLNLQTGVVTLLTSSVADVEPFVGSLSNSADATNPLQFTAIIPAQSLSGACVEITLTDGTIYYYHAVNPIALTASATNTLNLNIADKKVITASGVPAITAWNAVSSSGSLGESVNNLITLYWLAPHADYATIDKITVSVVDIFNHRREIDVTPTIDPLSSAEYATITFPLTIAGAGYPQIIESLKLYAGSTLLRNSPRAAILGSVLSRAGAHTIGLNLAIDITPKSWLNVAGTGGSTTITVATIGTTKWTATAVSSTGAGLTVTPATATTATVAWATQTAEAEPRTGVVTFQTDPLGATETLTTAQLIGPPPALTLSSYAPGVTVPKGGGTYYTNVVSNFAWTASALTNVSLTPTTGPAGTTAVTITVPTTALTTTRTVSTKFTTNTVPSGTVAAQTWTGTQAAAALFESVNIGGTYWALSNAGTATWANAPALCPSPWRLPSQADFQNLIASGKISQVTGISSGGYWSSTSYNTTVAYRLNLGLIGYNNKTSANDVRCCQ